MNKVVFLNFIPLSNVSQEYLTAQISNFVKIFVDTMQDIEKDNGFEVIDCCNVYEQQLFEQRDLNIWMSDPLSPRKHGEHRLLYFEYISSILLGSPSSKKTFVILNFIQDMFDIGMMFVLFRNLNAVNAFVWLDDGVPLLKTDLVYTKPDNEPYEQILKAGGRVEGRVITIEEISNWYGVFNMNNHRLFSRKGMSTNELFDVSVFDNEVLTNLRVFERYSLITTPGMLFFYFYYKMMLKPSHWEDTMIYVYLRLRSAGEISTYSDTVGKLIDLLQWQLQVQEENFIQSKDMVLMSKRMSLWSSSNHRILNILNLFQAYFPLKIPFTYVCSIRSQYILISRLYSLLESCIWNVDTIMNDHMLVLPTTTALTMNDVVTVATMENNYWYTHDKLYDEWYEDYGNHYDDPPAIDCLMVGDSLAIYLVDLKLNLRIIIRNDGEEEEWEEVHKHVPFIVSCKVWCGSLTTSLLKEKRSSSGGVIRNVFFKDILNREEERLKKKRCLYVSMRDILMRDRCNLTGFEFSKRIDYLFGLRKNIVKVMNSYNKQGRDPLLHIYTCDYQSIYDRSFMSILQKKHYSLSLQCNRLAYNWSIPKYYHMSDEYSIEIYLKYRDEEKAFYTSDDHRITSMDRILLNQFSRCYTNDISLYDLYPKEIVLFRLKDTFCDWLQKEMSEDPSKEISPDILWIKFNESLRFCMPARWKGCAHTIAEIKNEMGMHWMNKQNVCEIFKKYISLYK